MAKRITSNLSAMQFYDNIDLKLTQVVDIIGVLDLSTTTEEYV